MSETYSFLRLRDVIDAKIERRLSLRAELAAIDAELVAAAAQLAEVPSLSRTAPPATNAVEAVASASSMTSGRKKPLQDYVCDLPSCRKPFQAKTLHKGRAHFCSRACLADAARIRLAGQWKADRMLRRPHTRLHAINS